jgi:hypothetical protein
MIKSFVDLLFILLCSTIIMLSQSLRIGSIKASPVKLGSGGISEVKADDVRVAVVGNEYIEFIGSNGNTKKVKSPSEIAPFLKSNECILLTIKNPDLSHQRVMSCWQGFRKEGIEVKLAAVVEKPPQLLRK